MSSTFHALLYTELKGIRSVRYPTCVLVNLLICVENGCKVFEKRELMGYKEDEILTGANLHHMLTTNCDRMRQGTCVL